MPDAFGILTRAASRAVHLATAAQSGRASPRQFSWYLGVLIILAVFAVLLFFVLFLRVARAYWLAHPQPRRAKSPPGPPVDPWEESARRMPTPPPPDTPPNDDRGHGTDGGWSPRSGDPPPPPSPPGGYVPRHPPRQPPPSR